MDETVSFGYEQVTREEKTRRVRGVFSSVASKYDIMNDAMSGGMHRLWKDQFVRRVKPRPGEDILDMAGGTGDIAFRVMEASGPRASANPSPGSHPGSSSRPSPDRRSHHHQTGDA
jgi:demethylmenaquinone methyltransferase/2-methoxy-6-polyprenyl-1,4-benzoquinol methylase